MQIFSFFFYIIFAGIADGADHGSNTHFWENAKAMRNQEHNESYFIRVNGMRINAMSYSKYNPK